MLDLDFSIIPEALPTLWRGLIVTFQITVIAIIGGVLLGLLLAVMRLSPVAPLRWIARVYVDVFRSVPLIMVLLWFYLLVPQFIDWLLLQIPHMAAFFGFSEEVVASVTPAVGGDKRLESAIIAFVMFEAAQYSEIIRAGVNSLPKGQSHAALALGMSRGQSFRLVILPQAFRAMTPLLLTQGIILFQDTSLVYVMSLADFFRSATNFGKTTGYEVEMVLFAGLIYFLICALASLFVSTLARKPATR